MSRVRPLQGVAVPPCAWPGACVCTLGLLLGSCSPASGFRFGLAEWGKWLKHRCLAIEAFKIFLTFKTLEYRIICFFVILSASLFCHCRYPRSMWGLMYLVMLIFGRQGPQY